MLKDFYNWNIQTKEIDAISNSLIFKEREIWFIKMGENVGFEQCGRGDEFLRPVIIYKKFSKNLFIGIPLTSKTKVGKFYENFNFKNRSSSAILSQVRLFDSKRLKYKIVRISQGDFKRIKEKLIKLLQ